jgi:hypothetical protein
MPDARLSLSARARTALRAARHLYWGLRPRGEENAFSALRSRFYKSFWKEAAAAVGAELRELDASYLQAKRGNAWTVIRLGQIALDDQLRAGLARNKMLTANLLAPHGFTTPESVTFDLDTLGKAQEFLAGARCALVVKPDGVPKSRFCAPGGPGSGRGVTCGVRKPEELARAARWGALFGAKLIAEKQIEGASYRLLYLEGELIDAVRRDPPRLFGDGVSSIAELVYAENAERRCARPPLALSPIAVDLDCRLTLARQGLSLRSVPRALEALTVKTVCNENAAYDNHVVRDSVHPELARLGGELVRHLGLRLAGVDVMSQDLSRPPSEGAFVFNEINANPGLHHHWMVAEPERRAPVGAMVLEAALA